MNRALLPILGLFGALLALFCSACADAGDRDGDGRLEVVVSVPALAWIASSVAPEAHITVLVPPGASPHAYEMRPSQAAALASADVVILVGLGLEPASITGAVPDGAEAIVIRLADALGADAHEVVVEQHDHDGHAHGSSDPHLWLDPAFVRYGVAQLAAALQIDPKPALFEVSAVESEYLRALAPYRGFGVVGMHDAWSRLAERFGLVSTASIMGRSEIEATPGAIERAAEALRAGPPSVVVVEQQIDPTLARRLSDLTGAPLVALDPLGGEDWPATMRTNLAHLVEGLEAARTKGGDAP